MCSINFLKVVIILRVVGYGCQFFSGLFFAGLLNFICALPLVLWSDAKDTKIKPLFKYLSDHAVQIHSYAGVTSSLIIIINELINYFYNRNIGYLVLVLFGFFLFLSFILFNSSVSTTSIPFMYFIVNNKHKLGSLMLFIANGLQYYAGVLLGKKGLSLASLFFIMSMILLFFVKSKKITMSNSK